MQIFSWIFYTLAMLVIIYMIILKSSLKKAMLNILQRPIKSIETKINKAIKLASIEVNDDNINTYLLKNAVSIIYPFGSKFFSSFSSLIMIIGLILLILTLILKLWFIAIGYLIIVVLAGSVGSNFNGDSMRREFINFQARIDMKNNKGVVNATLLQYYLDKNARIVASFHEYYHKHLP